MKKFFKVLAFVIGIVLVLVTLVRYTLSIVYSYNNYEHNKNLTVNEYLIYDQDYYDSFKFGLGNVADHGCGVVAIYNILKLEDKEIPLAEIIKDCDPFGTNAIGLLGTNPSFVSRYLKQQGLDVKVYFKDFEENAKNGKYIIFCYLGLQGGHYMVFYNNNGTDFSTINPTSSNVDLSDYANSEKGVKFIYVIN